LADNVPRKLRIATSGTGYFSRFHYEAWQRIPEVELVAIANRTAAAANEIASKYGVANVFDDVSKMLDEVEPDVLDIITPPETHLSSLEAAARRGIFAICQKPFCRTLVEAESAVRIAAASGSTIVIHENFRFQPWYGEIKRCLETGLLGKVWQCTFRLRPGDGQGPRAYLDRQPYFQKMPRFLIHETGIHLIDVFRFLFGEVTSVYAQLDRLNPVIAGEDAGILILKCAEGVRSIFDGNRLADHAASNCRLTMGEMLIEGERGTMRLDGNGNLYRRQHGEDRESHHAYDWSNSGFAGDCVWRFQNHVVRHILYGERLHNTGDSYLANIKVEEAAYASNAQGRRVEL
jgi:predicted dehydrogenase